MHCQAPSRLVFEAIVKDQAWFEMRDIRRRHLNAAVWIPLRVGQLIEDVGLYGDLGHVHDFYGAGSLAIPLASKDKVETPDWHDIEADTGPTPGFFPSTHRSLRLQKENSPCP